MRRIITNNGQIGVTLAVTIVSILLSVIITFSILTLAGVSEELYRISLIISVVAPATIAPLVTWYLVKLLVKVHDLEQQQRRLATYDGLTGALNRRAFFESFETIKQQIEKEQTDLTLAYMDLDDFKPINDLYGHVVGDKVLKSFVATLRNELRSSDLIARVGGEEFVIVLPNTDINNAQTILDRIRNKVADDPLTIEGHCINLSVSIGLSQNKKHHSLIIDQLIQEADKALYKAKEAGKNCIVQYA
ncbi:GGDEF domain-containing protein [Neptuniibacter sp. PT34_22]|uniref:GGDEF domain-containing protein n=1 Tax=Neptuniibacter sp. PT34_22 TaxID=3398205 RepID=UPI0039F5F291